MACLSGCFRGCPTTGRIGALAGPASAAGEIAHAGDGWAEGEVIEAVQTLMEISFSSPLATVYMIPPGFWSTQFGQIVLSAQLWASGDELLTLSQAAARAGVSVQAISNALRAGRLRRYVDPAEKNPQRAGRVSRREVEAVSWRPRARRQ